MGSTDFAQQKSILKKSLGDENSQVDLYVKSPGRFNLIGEHTDYNGGFVVPGCLDRHIFLAFQKLSVAENNSQEGSFICEVIGLSTNEKTRIEKISKEGSSTQKYISGVLDYLYSRIDKDIASKIRFRVAITSDLPIGGGISSSAALCCGIGFGLNKLYNLGFDQMELAKAARWSENEFIGIACGFMDQFIVSHGKSGCTFKQDCRSLDFEAIDINQKGNYSIMLANTLVKHNLVESEYNLRRSSCETVVKKLSEKLGRELLTLRDQELSEQNQYKSDLSETEYKRAKYAIEENFRVDSLLKALRDKDWMKAKQVMTEAHYGLKDEYEVSCPELDFQVFLYFDKKIGEVD